MKNSTKKIFKKVFGNKIKLNENSDMNNTFIWDSLTHIKIIVEIEKF